MDREDVYLAARLLIEHYGADASLQAKQNVEALVARGDMESAMAWNRVLRAIQEIQPKATRH
jgi:hypothetical protein